MISIFDKILQMQAQGYKDQDIFQRLRSEGVSPQEINDSLNQVKIKNAVAQAPENNFQNTVEQYEQTVDNSPQQEEEQFQESQYLPGEEQEQQQAILQNPPNNGYYYPDAPQGYSEGSYYPQQNPQDFSTITEVTEQIISDKFNEFSKKTGDLVFFRDHTEEKLHEIEDRLKRIENSLDNIQNAIIGKIRGFDETTSYVHKDLTNLHDTMSKLMNPLVDNYRALKKLAEK